MSEKELKLPTSLKRAILNKLVDLTEGEFIKPLRKSMVDDTTSRLLKRGYAVTNVDGEFSYNSKKDFIRLEGKIIKDDLLRRLCQSTNSFNAFREGINCDICFGFYSSNEKVFIVAISEKPLDDKYQGILEAIKGDITAIASELVELRYRELDYALSKHTNIIVL